MKVKVIEKHDGEGRFPTFKKGTEVVIIEACTHYLHWYACTIEKHATYVAESYVNKGKLIRNYNPTELIQNIGDILEVKEITNSWLYAVNENKISGWIPADKVVSV